MNNELVPQPSWWKRNWKWFIPLSGCLGIIVLLVVFIGSVFYGVTSLIEGSEPYEYAIEKINQDEEITELMGTPIIKDGMVQGTLNYNNDEGSAALRIPISGPKKKGMLFINATSKGDEWTYQEIRVDVKDIEPINLLEDDDLEQF